MAELFGIGGVARTARLTGTLLAAAFRAETQYRASFLMVSAGLFYQGVGFAFVWVVLGRFDTIAGWGIGEIAFLYGVRLLAHGLFAVPFNRMLDLDQLVQKAEFDRFLVRPLDPLVQLLTSKLWLGSFGDVVGGIAIFVGAVFVVDIDWSPVAIGYLALAILGGAMVEASFNLAFAALTFRLMSARTLLLLADNVFSTVGNYPLTIFGRATEFALTYVAPLAFVAYVPASVLLGRTGALMVPAWLAYAAPLVGLLTFTLAYQLWRFELRHYSSSGH